MHTCTGGYPFQQPTREEIASFLGHFTSEQDRQKFYFANAAALYGLDLVGRSASPIKHAAKPNANTTSTVKNRSNREKDSHDFSAAGLTHTRWSSAAER